MNEPAAAAVARVDGNRARVSGEARFTSDIPGEGVLHAAFVLSPEPHARLLGVDTSEAVAVPGVEAVITGADIGLRLFGRSLCDYPVLAVDRVLFAGQRVAAVAACDAQTAREAAELVMVEYEPLDALLSLEDVMSGPDIELHPDGASYRGANEDHHQGNLQGQEAAIDGDVDAAFSGCGEIHEHTFVWDRSHSAPIEPHSCLVDASGPRIKVWAANKVPNRLRAELAGLTGRPERDFVVHPANIGGDFGSKAAPYIEAACYFLSERTGRPVRSTLSYLELLTSTAARHPGYMRLRTGLREGRLHAHEAETVLDGGAFAAIKPRPSRVVSVLHHPLGPYEITTRDERVMAVYSNNLPGGHVRSPGEFQAVFAGESHIDIIARSRREDPVEFRLRHTRVPETRRILEELASIVGAWRSDGAQGSGIGVSVFNCAAGSGKSTVACEATRSGVTLFVGVPDQGSGMYPSFRRLAADILALPADAVGIEPVGADETLIDAGAGSSRVTAIVGNACIDACQRLLAEIGGPPTEAPGTYWIADRLAELDRSSCRTTAQRAVSRSEAETVRPSYGGLAVQVAVDTQTGAIELRQATHVVETGRIVNPVGFRGQLEGGFVYGLSQTLYEQLVVEDGQLVTASLGDYKIACAGDIPPLEIRHVHAGPEPDDQIRAVGELTNIGVAPAVANALDDAVGVRLLELPITAERVWHGLRRRPQAEVRVASTRL